VRKGRCLAKVRGQSEAFSFEWHHIALIRPKDLLIGALRGVSTPAVDIPKHVQEPSGQS
jgi:hypothetical protein